MQDELRPGIESLDGLDGVTSPIFHRVLPAGDDEAARLDALAVAGALVGRIEAVSVPDAADLIAIGSGPEAVPGRIRLARAGEALLRGAPCPVALAPRGIAGRDDHHLRRIAVGVDGSREAAAALATAVHLARTHDARLRLVAVAELDPEPGGRPWHADPREVDRLARHLEHAAVDLTDVRVETDLREGSADQILIGLSRDADLMVLGSRAAYGDRGRVSLGEAAVRILGGAACPILVVPAP